MSLFNSLLSKSASGNVTADGATQAEYTLKPAYRVNQTPEAWTLTAQLPGVTKDGLEVTAEDGVISVRGRRQWRQPEAWTSLYRESYDADYALTFRYDHTVDADRIQAELKDGVLQVTLPKAEAAKARKIAIN